MTLPKLKLGLPGSMPDATLVKLLLHKGILNDTQMTDLVASSARIASGRPLTKLERDRWMNTAMAQKLTDRVKLRKPKDGQGVNMGDCYSTTITEGTRAAEKVLAGAHTKTGEMISPPGTRRTG